MDECKNCKYYLIYEAGCRYGQCHFNPPAIMPSSAKINTYPVGEYGKDSIPRPIGVFPMVADFNWCGKFEPKARK